MIHSTIPKPVDRDEWLAARRPYFNASATSILFDRHPYMSPGDYATIKLTGVEQSQTSAMRRGVMLEDAIAQWWGIEHACAVETVDELYVNGPMMATPDRWALDDDCPIEIKTTSNYAPRPEPYWLDQCQSIMACTGADMCWLIWFDPSMALNEYRVNAYPELQAEILSRAERFMAAIELGIVPDWIELSYDNIAKLHPEPEGVAELDDEALNLVRELHTLRQIRKDAAKEEDLTKDAIAKLLLGHEVGTWNGIEVVTWKVTRPSTQLDVDMLRADHPDLVERYSRERPGTRRMLVKLGEPA